MIWDEFYVILANGERIRLTHGHSEELSSLAAGIAGFLRGVDGDADPGDDRAAGW